jgi:starvation-inducible DNA-binding protein
MAVAPRPRRSAQDIKAVIQEVAGRPVAGSLAFHLHRGVGNSFALYTNYKHYHWQTQAPRYRDLHLVFGDFALDVLGSLDDLANRIRAISEEPPTHLLDAMDLARVAAAAPHVTLRGMIEEAVRNVHLMVEQLREASTIARAYDDQGTIDVTTSLIHVYERQKWWLRDILAKREGLQLM